MSRTSCPGTLSRPDTHAWSWAIRQAICVRDSSSEGGDNLVECTTEHRIGCQRRSDGVVGAPEPRKVADGVRSDRVQGDVAGARPGCVPRLDDDASNGICSQGIRIGVRHRGVGQHHRSVDVAPRG